MLMLYPFMMGHKNYPYLTSSGSVPLGYPTRSYMQAVSVVDIYATGRRIFSDAGKTTALDVRIKKQIPAGAAQCSRRGTSCTIRSFRRPRGE